MASTHLGKVSTPTESSTLPFSSPASPTTVHLNRSGTDTTGGPSSGVKDGPGAGGGGIFGPRARASPGWFRREAPQLIGEFFGTFLFLFLAYISAQVALGNDPNAALGLPLAPATLLYIAAGFGGALLVALWTFKGISGEMFNPAISVGLLVIGAITPFQAILHIPVQLLAAICAAALADALTPGQLLVGNALASSVSPARGLFIEALMTAQLVLAVFLLSRPPRPHPAAHAGIALSVFMGHLSSVNFTGTGINPARSLGPDVVNAHFKGTAWVYYIGPLIGSLIAVAVFALLRWLEASTISHRDSGVSRIGRNHDLEHGDGGEGASRA